MSVGCWGGRRSGKYQQANGTLRTADDPTGKPAYCCLGVLCDLYGNEKGQEVWDRAGSFIGHNEFDDRLEIDDVLPDEVVAWAGLDDTDPLLTNAQGVKHNASAWNDGHKSIPNGREPNRDPASFTEIADMIEVSL